MVQKAKKAWQILVHQIAKWSILQQILGSGRPSKGRNIFEKYYGPKPAAEKARLAPEWYSLRMQESEPPSECFARGNFLGSRLSSHGVVLSDVTLIIVFLETFPPFSEFKRAFCSQIQIRVPKPSTVWCSAHTGRWRW